MIDLAGSFSEKKKKRNEHTSAYHNPGLLNPHSSYLILHVLQARILLELYTTRKCLTKPPISRNYIIKSLCLAISNGDSEGQRLSIKVS